MSAVVTARCDMRARCSAGNLATTLGYFAGYQILMVPELRAMISRKASTMSYCLLSRSSGSTHQMNVRAAKRMLADG
jgi:hypothetical protein